MFEKLFFFTDAFYQFAKGLLLILVFGALVLNYGGALTWVIGDSMNPALKTGQIAFVDKVSYRLSHPERGDIVQLKFPGDIEHTRYVKRIIGMPGETISIKNDRVLINGKPLAEAYLDPSIHMTNSTKDWQLGPDEYFMMGDNRPRSNDSRQFGAVERRYIIGLVRYVIWPPDQSTIVK
jgi:signal peptidase I